MGAVRNYFVDHFICVTHLLGSDIIESLLKAVCVTCFNPNAAIFLETFQYLSILLVL